MMLQITLAAIGTCMLAFLCLLVLVVCQECLRTYKQRKLALYQNID